MLSLEKSKILVIRFSSFGDVLLSTCVVRAIKHTHPHTSITFLVKKSFRVMIENNPNINHIVEYEQNDIINELKSQHFDFIVDLQNNQRSWKIRNKLNIPFSVYKKNRLKRFLFMKFGYRNFNNPVVSVPQKYLNTLKPLGIESDDTSPEFILNPSIHIQLPENYVCIAPGAAHFTKQWPVEYYIDLINQLGSSKKIVLIGGKNETTTAKTIESSSRNILNLVGKLSFDETAVVINQSDLLICNDSSIMHLGVALKKKVLAFFGSTVEQFGFFPYDTVHKVLENNSIGCRPCTHIGRKKCPKKHFKCMYTISPKNAFDEANKLLEC